MFFPQDNSYSGESKKVRITIGNVSSSPVHYSFYIFYIKNKNFWRRKLVKRKKTRVGGVVWFLLSFSCPPPFIKHQSVNNKWTTMFNDQIYALEFSCLKESTNCIHNLLCKHFNGIYIHFSYELVRSWAIVNSNSETKVACKQWPRFLKWTFISSFITLLSKKFFFLFYLNWNTRARTHTNGKRHHVFGIWMCKIFKYLFVSCHKKQIPKVLSHWVLILKQYCGIVWITHLQY